jgi:hypothetical protein
MADWARLLSECWGLNLSRGFESRPPRQKKNASISGAFCIQPRSPSGAHPQGALKGLFESRPPRQKKNTLGQRSF